VTTDRSPALESKVLCDDAVRTRLPAESTAAGARSGAKAAVGRSAEGAAGSSVPVLRCNKPPVDELDFKDRHDTRATESEEMANRYAKLRKDRRTNDWHYLAMGLVSFVFVATVYLVGFVLVSRLFPHLDAKVAASIVGAACMAGGGGVAARSLGRALRQRHAGQGTIGRPTA
jgi:hypothetical protein